MSSKAKYIVSIFLLISCLYRPCTGQNAYVQRSGILLRDSTGRMLLLRGLNYINKDSKNQYLNLIKDEAFVKMRSWGYNAVRLGINWSALEPSPGSYDSVYLHDLDRRLQYAKEQGIYVILDMHQDLFSEKFGNGAPLWATLDEDKPHYTGGTWSDAYYISPAVQAAFDNFWNNTFTTTGIGVQDHYIKTWVMLAERYRNDNNIVGFDVMNEPFIGSAVGEAMQAMITEVTSFLNQKNTGKTYTAEEVSAMWMDEKGKSFILKTLTDKEVFVRALQRMEPTYRSFEENKLLPFYRKLAVAIRKVNKAHILFWEPSVSSNNGIPSCISPVTEAGNQQGYMPHFYDIVLDTEQAGEADPGRLAFMFTQLRYTMQKLQLPALIGEWGAFYGGDRGVVSAAAIMAAGIDSLLAGDFYWDYFSGLENQAYFKEVLQRPYMQAAAGKIIKQSAGKNSLLLTWQEDRITKADNLVFIPASENLKITGKVKYSILRLNDNGGCLLKIAPLNRRTIRTIKIYWEKQ
ncbi:glycoside hydrolase family 5 protein [Niabella aquatica]